jgi:hypothetical protein
MAPSSENHSRVVYGVVVYIKTFVHEGWHYLQRNDAMVVSDFTYGFLINHICPRRKSEASLSSFVPDKQLFNCQSAAINLIRKKETEMICGRKTHPDKSTRFPFMVCSSRHKRGFATYTHRRRQPLSTDIANHSRPSTPIPCPVPTSSPSMLRSRAIFKTARSRVPRFCAQSAITRKGYRA